MSRLGLIDRAATLGSPYTVTRIGAGSYDGNGVFTPGSSVQFTIIASIQPVSGRELQLLPEAQHAEEVQVVYTATELRTRNPSGAPDIVTISGEPWGVFRVELWNAWGETHYRAYVSRRTTP